MMGSTGDQELGLTVADRLHDGEARRLARLAAYSADQDALLVEFIWHNRWATFDISNLELQHLTVDQLWARHVRPALEAVGAPPGGAHGTPEVPAVTSSVPSALQ